MSGVLSDPLPPIGAASDVSVWVHTAYAVDQSGNVHPILEMREILLSLTTSLPDPFVHPANSARSTGSRRSAACQPATRWRRTEGSAPSTVLAACALWQVVQMPGRAEDCVKSMAGNGFAHLQGVKQSQGTEGSASSTAPLPGAATTAARALPR